MGFISLVLGAFLLYESFHVMKTAQALDVNNFAIYVGIIVSLIYIAIGILIFAMNNDRGRIANLVIAAISVIAFWLSFEGPLIFVDLPYCSVWAVICFITACIFFFKKKDCGKKNNSTGIVSHVSSPNSKICSNCGAANDASSKYCGACGKRITQTGVCPHCGAGVGDSDVFCHNCGKNLVDGSSGFVPNEEVQQATYEEEKSPFKKILPVILGILAVALLGGGGWYGYREYSAYNEKKLAREKFVADSLEQARRDSIEAVKQKEEKERLEKEKKLKMEACLNYVKKFYRDYEKTNQSEDFLRKHCTPNAIRILEEEYDYDCDGSCLATWIFFYEAGTDAELIKRSFRSVDENTCEVVNEMGINGVPSYNYIVTLGIVKEGNAYKIDNISYRSSN